MKIREYCTELKVDASADELFQFFANAGNLDAITPPWLHFRIITPQPIDMREGALIDYRLRVHGLPLRWRTRIMTWQPPHRFVDEQIRGPYRLWIHEHTFIPCAGGTIVRDHVRYAVPFDRLLHRWFVRPDIEKIFQFRAGALRIRFAGRQPEQQIGHAV
jgi:ligand-binding SRPBCC domain-containing protein